MAQGGWGSCWNLRLSHREVTNKQLSSTGLLLTSGSHWLKEVPVSALEILPIKVKFNHNQKQTTGTVHTQSVHVSGIFSPHQCLQGVWCTAVLYLFVLGLLFLQANLFLLYIWWIMSGLLSKWKESLSRGLQQNIFQTEGCTLKALGCYISSPWIYLWEFQLYLGLIFIPSHYSSLANHCIPVDAGICTGLS